MLLRSPAQLYRHVLATRIFAAAARRSHESECSCRGSWVSRVRIKLKQRRRCQSYFPRLAPPPRPPQQCPRRACRSDAHAADIGSVACGTGGGSAGASSPPRHDNEYAPPVEPNRPAVAAAATTGAAVGAPALALLDRTRTAFCSSAPPRLNTAATSLVMARCSSAKPFSVIAEARSWASAAEAPTVVLRKNTDQRENFRSMAKPPAVGGWFSNLTPAMRCYTFANEAH
jgi:hypothetical protein